jgi:hypothetical protein
MEKRDSIFKTYSSILGRLGPAALECLSVTLVLQALRSNQALDLGGLGVWLLALALWLDLTTDNVFSDLEITRGYTIKLGSSQGWATGEADGGVNSHRLPC